MARLLEPHARPIENRFLARLRERRFDAKQRTALAAITAGAAAGILASGKRLPEFFEQVEYNGRRLAKLNLPPSDILTALDEYDRLLTPMLAKLMIPSESANFAWVREQLHFCVVLTLNNAYYQVRESETDAYAELFRVEVESRSLDELLRRFLQTLAQSCRADVAHLYLLDQEGLQWKRMASTGGAVNGKAGRLAGVLPNTAALRRAIGRPRSFDLGRGGDGSLLDSSWRGRCRSCWSTPLRTGTRVAGVIQFGFEKAYEWLPREQELLAAAGERCLLAAEKARLMEDLAAREDEVRHLAERLLQVEEAERRRISRELHDEAGQSLLCIRLQMEMLEQTLPEDKTEWRAKLAEARDLTERTILEIRRLIAALSPAVLEQLGLGAALRQLVTRFSHLYPGQGQESAPAKRVRLNLSRLGSLPQKTEIIVYRLVQECLNNVAKHSMASNVNISLYSADGHLRLEVEDDGVGFRVDEAMAKHGSFGLSGLKERVALLGGKLLVESRPRAKDGQSSRRRARSGTKIQIDLPIPPVEVGR